MKYYRLAYCHPCQGPVAVVDFVQRDLPDDLAWYPELCCGHQGSFCTCDGCVKQGPDACENYACWCEDEEEYSGRHCFG